MVKNPPAIQETWVQSRCSLKDVKVDSLPYFLVSVHFLSSEMINIISFFFSDVLFYKTLCMYDQICIIHFSYQLTYHLYHIYTRITYTNSTYT